MTTGDYVLWFGALIVILILADRFVTLAKFAVNWAEEWGYWTAGASVMFMILVIVIISPTYYLVVRN